jgi:hypothetical protein
MTGTGEDGHDPLLDWNGRLERLNYQTGMLLDEQDFRDEQTYHRYSLATVLRHALGMGTLAGLDVKLAEPQNPDRLLTVYPGVALDRMGRLISLEAPQHIRLAIWLRQQPPEILANAVSNMKVTADIFLSLRTRGRQLTPVIASDPFNALDAVAPARLQSQPHLELLLRQEAGAAGIPEPLNQWPSDPAQQRDRVLAMIPAAGETLDPANMPRLREQVPGQDPGGVFLARTVIPVRSINGAFEPDPAGTVRIDSSKRPIIALPGKWLAAQA